MLKSLVLTVLNAWVKQPLFTCLGLAVMDWLSCLVNTDRGLISTGTGKNVVSALWNGKPLGFVITVAHF